MRPKKRCETCKYYLYDEEEEECFCDCKSSKHYSDWMSEFEKCDEWEEAENES